MILPQTSTEEKDPSNQLCQTPKQAFERWIFEVERGQKDPSEIVNLYSSEAILLPTLSPIMSFHPEMIRDYFIFLSTFTELKVRVKTLVTKTYGNIAMATGFYTFAFFKEGQYETVEARFDFWYRLEGNVWKIIFHHSSKVPGQNS